ncbi:MAG: GGDEF domain-containing protein [Gemmatimonadaceae bacterium]|nr:GGDEF domain-containing protein [Gemmatimonadaceae bacterium]
MLWIGLIVVVAAGAWLLRRRGVPRLVWPGDDSQPIVERSSVPPLPMASEEQRKSRTLLTAFRSDEFPAPVDAEQEDRRVIERALQLLAEHTGAAQSVLWRPDDEHDGVLTAVAWSPGAEPPVLHEQHALLVRLSAQEQRSTYNPGGPHLEVVSVGAMLGVERGAVSVHFRELPVDDRTTITEWVTRHGRGIADLYDAVRARSVLATRTNKLRAMVRTATTLQGSRDPMALERGLVRDACTVTGAEWATIVRWNNEERRGELSHSGESAPDFGPRVVAGPSSLVGEVCSSGQLRAFPDARPLHDPDEQVFDHVSLPHMVRSLCIAPLRRGGNEAAIGAILLGHSGRGRLAHNDAHAAADLGVIAAGALETAWAVREATERARTDQLTGLPNRRAFDESFGRIVAETDRYGGAMALVLADIDHFKRVNDTYGHEAGDQVLKAVGAVLTGARRGTDVVVRLGGEELALLLPQTEAQGAAEVAERLREAIEALRVRTSAGEIRVTSSFGVALYEARSGSATTLFERADKALYAAKHGGRNRVELDAS